MKLFEIDPAIRMVDLNKPWISTIKEFKALLVRDKGSVGDADGRKKAQALKEFTFIYHYCDYQSKFNNFSETDKYKECLRNADLNPDLDLEQDEPLLRAVIRYRELQETPALKTLTELKETLHSAHRVVKHLRSHLETMLTELDLKKILEAEVEDAEGKKKKNPVALITSYLTGVMDIANKIPDSINKIEEQEEKVRKELGDENALRGGVQKGVREDGSKQTKRGAVMDDI